MLMMISLFLACETPSVARDEAVCPAGDTCSWTCEGDCELTCEEETVCDADCDADATCALGSEGLSVYVDCTDATTCNVDCALTDDCEVICGNNAECTVGCPSENCTVRACDWAQGCLVTCGGSGAPTLTGLNATCP